MYEYNGFPSPQKGLIKQTHLITVGQSICEGSLSGFHEAPPGAAKFGRTCNQPHTHIHQAVRDWVCTINLFILPHFDPTGSWRQLVFLVQRSSEKPCGALQLLRGPPVLLLPKLVTGCGVPNLLLFLLSLFKVAVMLSFTLTDFGYGRRATCIMPQAKSGVICTPRPTDQGIPPP